LAVDEEAAPHPPPAAAPALRRDTAPDAFPLGALAPPPHRQPLAPPPANAGPLPSRDVTEPPGTTGLRAPQPRQDGPSAEPQPAEMPPPTVRRRTTPPGVQAEPPAPLAERAAPVRTETRFPRSLIGSRVVERLTELPVRGHGAAAPVPPGGVPLPAAAPAAPRVEIQIGRIEFAPPAAPAADPRRPPAPQPRPPQSLESYLQQRSKP
jgi:hypothetical protein